MSIERRPESGSVPVGPRVRAFSAQVVSCERLSPSFVRIAFQAKDLQSFGATGFDQKVRLVLPRPQVPLAALPLDETWHDQWRALPDDQRPTLRTYTVRSADVAQGIVTVDFVLHGHDNTSEMGPASWWAAQATPGQDVYLVGPEGIGVGRQWGYEWLPSAQITSVLIAGDETALPAMAAILDALPPAMDATVVCEVPTAHDQQAWTVPPGRQVQWLFRDQCADPVPGTSFEAAVCAAVESAAADPAGKRDGLYVWLAGESGVVKKVRRAVVGPLGVRRDHVVFAGYWRLGRTLE